MSGRYPQESRYVPRERSRTPPRYQQRRLSGTFNTGFARGGADAPRGPRAPNDGPRSGGFGGPAPLGPRGRGAPFRPEYRELRDAPPLGSDRDRSFRDRDYDNRRERLPSPPSRRSPPRGGFSRETGPFRDSRPPPPRELDISRDRRPSGPLSAGSNFSDPAPFNGPPYGRGGFSGRGRGRGRGDFDFRDRGRRGPLLDDRNSMRPRERSPVGRWPAREPSRGERDGWRDERRDDDRRSDRDERERDNDRFRRDVPPPSRFEPRQFNDVSPRPPTPHEQSAPQNPHFNDRPAPIDPQREDLLARRPPPPPSVAALPKEPKRDVPAQPDHLAGRAEATSNRYPGRASSPPPSAPQVPAFGSMPLPRPSGYNGPTSNVWKAPNEPRGPAPSQAPTQPAAVATSPVPKTAPIAPKAQLTAPPPTAPKAPRALDNFLSNKEPGPPPKPWASTFQPPPIPTAPMALRTEEKVSVPIAPSGPMNRDDRQGSRPSQSPAPVMPTSPRASRNQRLSDSNVAQSIPRLPTGEPDRRASFGQVTFDKKLAQQEVPPPRLGTPPPSAPSGPRNAFPFSTSPHLKSPGIPTAPKAIRGPPAAPRAVESRPPPLGRAPDRGAPPIGRAPPGPRAWNQWIRPGAPAYNAVTPAKRDANGEEKDALVPRSQEVPKQEITEPASGVADSKPASADHETVPKRASVSPRLLKKGVQQDISLDQPVSQGGQSANAVDEKLSISKQLPQPLDDAMSEASASDDDFSDDDEDDGMDLGEEDFAQNKNNFEREKARLESQLIDLSDRKYRASTPFEQIARLARVSAKDIPDEPDVTPSSEEQSVVHEEEQVHPDPESQDAEEAPEQELVMLKEEEEEEEEPEDVDMADSHLLDNIMPPRRLTPEILNLPYLNKEAPPTPLSEREAFQETVNRQKANKEHLLTALRVKQEDENAEEADLEQAYMIVYRNWRLVVTSLDRARDDRERVERQKSADLGTEPETSIAPAETEVSERRGRAHKFSSEYDIMKVLKESEETARLERERQEHEAKQAEVDMQKEAVIPEMRDEEMRARRVFKNSNRYRSAWRLTEIFGYEPPLTDFTEEEQQVFIDAFKERPKKWGEIASRLPGRTYQDCIHHYYAFKWDGRFRETKGRRRGKGMGKRGGKGSRVKGAALMADLSRTEDGPNGTGSVGLGLTETGRPKRSATRTTYSEKDIEARNAASTSTPGRKAVPKGDASGDSVAEKPLKRRKTAAEKVPRKAKTQPLAAAPAASPVKTDREPLLQRVPEPRREEFTRQQQDFEGASLLASLHAGHHPLANEMPMYHQEQYMHAAPMAEHERSRPPTQPLQKASASSYWSVPEQTDFLKYIAHFGTDFAAIAAHMGTKTQTMVKNYYQRHVESGNRQDLVDAANQANARRERGEDMGAPPTPTPIVKRRYDNPPLAVTRALAPHTDAMELDEPVTTSLGSTAIPVSASHYSAQPRFSISQGTPILQRMQTTSVTRAETPPLPQRQSQGSQPRASQPAPGPKMGFFTDARSERSRPPIQPLSSGSQFQQQPSQPPALLPHRMSQEQVHMFHEAQDPNSAWRRELIREQERAMELQAREERLSQDSIPQLPPGHPLHAQIGQAPAMTPQLHAAPADRKPFVEERAPTPVLSAIPTSRPGQSILRNIVSPSASLAATPLQPPVRLVPNPSPPKQEEFRPSSGPIGSPAQTFLKASAPPEPRKTSNLASLLNSEPEEPRPKKRVSDQGLPAASNRPQSPAPSMLQGSHSGTPVGISQQQPRDIYGQPPMANRSLFHRGSFSQPSQGPGMTPVQVKNEPAPPGQPQPSSVPRHDWASRVPGGQPPPQSSTPQPALERDVRPYFSHRAQAFGSMNQPGRHNPSPPPHAHPLAHSRTPSFSQPQPAPQQQVHSIPPTPQPQTSQILHPNPYAQAPGPAAHIQHMQAQQQNQLHHGHNSSLGGGMHQRTISRGEEVHRQHEQAWRDHADRMELERRDAAEQRNRAEQYQAQVRQEYAAAAHRSAQPQQQQQPQPPQAMHSSVTPTPMPVGAAPPKLSMREQALREADMRYREEQLRYEQEMKEQEIRAGRAREEDERRRYEEQVRAEMYRRTPHGGGGFVPPGGHRR